MQSTTRAASHAFSTMEPYALSWTFDSQILQSPNLRRQHIHWAVIFLLNLDSLHEKEFLIFAPILLALLISSSPADADSASPASADLFRVSVGDMSFPGNTIKLTKSVKFQGGRFSVSGFPLIKRGQ